MRFAMNLANLRKKKNVSQRTAASALGVSQALLSHYENELREPGLEFLVNASRYYACSVDALLGVQPANSSGSAANLPAEGSTAPRAAAALLAAAAESGGEELSALVDEYLAAAVRRLAAVMAGEPLREISALEALLKADECAVCTLLETGGALRVSMPEVQAQLEERIGELEKRGFFRR